MDVNDRPVIGILTQEVDPALRAALPTSTANATSYLAHSYIQWVEAGGARSVPVIIGRQREYYTKALCSPALYMALTTPITVYIVVQ